jgi:hypothetical protein
MDLIQFMSLNIQSKLLLHTSLASALAVGGHSWGFEELDTRVERYGSIVSHPNLVFVVLPPSSIHRSHLDHIQKSKDSFYK